MIRIWNFIKRLFGFGSVSQKVPPLQTDKAESTDTPVSAGSASSGITPGVIRAVSNQEYALILKAFCDIQKVVASKEFEDAVLAFHFNPVLTLGKSNQEILDLYRKSNASVNIETFYGSWYENRISKTEAYERNEEGFIRINRYFIYERIPFGSVIMHELGHGFGFTHPNLEQNSVSYGMNQIYESVAPKVIDR